jgi:hypothetical protein
MESTTGNCGVKKQSLNKYIVLCLILIYTILLQSCKTVEPVASAPVDSKINFKLYEWHPVSNNDDIGKPEIFLNMSTDKSYPCCNYGLNFTKVISGKNITLTIYSVSEPDICLTAFGPAVESIPCNLPDGAYNLGIIINHVQDKYSVTISDKNIYIKSISNKNSYPLYENYYRYPAKSFAYFCGTNLNSKYIWEDFLDTLKSKISITEYTFPDSGQKPYPEIMGGHYYDPPAKYFTYNSEEDYDKIGQIMNTYTKNHSKDMDGVGISVTNWLNKNFYSWIEY